jgi:hypothetical protein
VPEALAQVTRQALVVDSVVTAAVPLVELRALAEIPEAVAEAEAQVLSLAVTEPF